MWGGTLTLEACADRALEGSLQDVHPLRGPDPEITTLLATLLGSGKCTAAALASAGRLLEHYASEAELARASAEEIRICGRITARQASLLRAALLLGNRICWEPPRPGQHFANSRDLYDRYRARFFTAAKEYFLALHLNSKNRLIREVLVSIGSLTCSVVHPREVFGPAVRDSSAAIVFVHNHPSGDPQPSREDRECTTRLLKAGRILGIRVLDHVIVGHDEYFSFADAGLLRDGDFP